MPDNTIEWGQGAVNNSIGWGKAKTNNTIDFGAIYDDSPSGDTNLTGASGFTNTKSVQFDGVDSDVRFSTIDLGTTSTVSMWIKPDTGYTGVLLGSETYNGDYMVYFSTSSLFIRIDTVVKSYSTTYSNITAGSWNHLVITRNGDSISTYVDGSFIQTLTGFGTTVNTKFDTIANRQTGSLPWEGKIDEVSAYDSVLSSSDITAIYNSGTPTDLSTYSPYLWYRMGDGDTFPTLTDGGSGGNDGTMTNMASNDIVDFVPDATVGVANTKSLSFDGVNDYLQVGDVDILSFGDGTNDSAFSMSAWIKTSTTGRGILSKWGSASTGYEYIIYSVNDKIRVALYDDNTSNNRKRDGNTTITTGEWTHVCVTYDGRGGDTANQGIKIYINATEESSYTDDGAGTYVAMHNSVRPVQIGAYNNAAFWLGNLDEIAVFDYELSSSAVSEIYNIRGSGRAADMNNLTNATTDPILWYRMGDGDTFSTITDNGTGGNDGTMTNMASDDIVNDTF